jgi:hypothetical protein
MLTIENNVVSGTLDITYRVAPYKDAPLEECWKIRSSIDYTGITLKELVTRAAKNDKVRMQAIDRELGKEASLEARSEPTHWRAVGTNPNKTKEAAKSAFAAMTKEEREQVLRDLGYNV